MAIRYAVASGLWSSTSTWDGGTLPGTTDDVYTNNFTVSIDQTVTVNSLKKIANGSPAITAGGSFVVTAAATVTITAGIAAADGATISTYILGVNAGSGAVTITASAGIAGGAGNGRVAVSILSGQSGTVTVNAPLVGGASGTGCHALTSAATDGSIVINGNVTAGASAAAVAITGPADVAVTGAIAGLGAAAAHGMTFAASGCTLAVTGAITGGTASTAVGVAVTGGTLSVTASGGVTGGTTAGNSGVSVSSGAALTIDSALAGGTAGNAVAVSSGGVATIRGTLTASTGAHALESSGSCRVSGGLHFASNSRAPISGLWTVIAGEETELHLFDDGAFPASNAGSPVILSLAGTDNPDEADVRDGVTFGASGTLTGTLAVPPPTSVAAGVPTDDTVGTAAVSLADVLAGTGAQIAAATSG